MKNLFVFAAVFFAVSLLGCQDTKDENVSNPDVSTIKSIGMQISNETGRLWIEAYNKQNNIAGRLIGSQYSVSAPQLQACASSVSDLAGMTFHHATDDAGVHHFIIVPVDGSLSVWSDVEGKIYLDANTDTAISRDQAVEWTNNYKQNNPGEIWFHLFGKNIFDEIFSISFFETMEIQPALNILNLTPQLLLIVEDENILNIGGRSETTSRTYDASSPCPPCPM
jgi:hypothetical protein